MEVGQRALDGGAGLPLGSTTDPTARTHTADVSTGNVRSNGVRFEHSSSLDGLRGVAVAAVVVYHLWPNVLPGGFIGVDLFFVLSGFLLSALLVREVETNGSVDVTGFFIRRFRRLLPATILLLVAICAYAAIWAEEVELARLRRHAYGALTYTINWLFIADGTTYTDVVVGASPLRHMWSLAIEEQFYIVLAVGAAIVASRSRGDRFRHRMLVIAGVGALLSAVAMFVAEFSGASRARTYFGTDTRAQALLIGVVVGVAVGDRLLAKRGSTATHRALPMLGAAGAGVWVVLVFTASEDADWMYRGGFTLVALAAAAAIAFALESVAFGRVLSVPPLVGLGMISYGVYLWHWPILVIIDDDRVGFGGLPLALIQIGLTLTISIASFLLVERPIRRGALGRRYGSFAVMAAPLAVIGTAILIAGSMRVPETLGESRTSVEDPAEADPDTAPGATTSDPLRVAMLGDSVAHTLIGGELTGFLDSVPWTPDQTSFDPGRVAIVDVARPACSFLVGELAFEQPNGSFEIASLEQFCDGWQEDLALAIDPTEDDPVQLTMVLSTNDIEDRSVDGEIVEIGTAEWKDLYVSWLDEVRALTVTSDSGLVLLATPPRLDPPWVDPPAVREALVADILATYAERHEGVEVIDLGDFVNDRDDLRYDGLHYTPSGAAMLAEWLTPQLETILEDRKSR